MFSLPDPTTLFAYLTILLICFPVHELAHAYTADYFGDDTPRRSGRLSLNPLAHLDVLGSLLMITQGFGWAKPVPVNPYALSRRSPSAMMWVSLAGPMSNFLMAILAAIPFRLGLVSLAQAQADFFSGAGRFIPTLPQFLLVFVQVNLLLMLFNLIPLFPLDGEKVFGHFAPASWARFLESIRPISPIILLGLGFLGVLGVIIVPPLNILIRLLVGS